MAPLLVFTVKSDGEGQRNREPDTAAPRKVELICRDCVSCELSALGAQSQRSDVPPE